MLRRPHWPVGRDDLIGQETCRPLACARGVVEARMRSAAVRTQLLQPLQFTRSTNYELVSRADLQLLVIEAIKRLYTLYQHFSLYRLT